jgi:hypothetical protein
MVVGLTAVFFFAPIFSLPQLEYPPQPAGSGIPCDRLTWIISRQASPSAVLFGFGGVRFGMTKYFPGYCQYLTPPYTDEYYIWAWDCSNITQYLR